VAKHTKVIGVSVVLLFAAVIVAGCGNQAGEKKTAAPAGAKSEQAVPYHEATLPPEIAAMRDRWAGATLDWVAGVLKASPPDTVRRPRRELALVSLDDVLHLTGAPQMAAVAAFFSSQTELALKEIEGPAPQSGARVWKLYNHGFVIRTAHHCYGFDIVPGVDETSMSGEQMGRLADMLEVLFISHRHGDHADGKFAQMMLDRDKTVVINPNVWEDKRPSTGKLIRIGGDRSGAVNGIKFEVFPGHQENIPNNVYLVTADSVNVMHTGDQYSRSDLEDWIKDFSQSWHVDILLPNCWTLDIGRMVSEIAPRVVITGHENELGHTVDHRESFAKTYLQLVGLRAPYVVMSWGEMYQWNP